MDKSFQGDKVKSYSASSFFGGEGCCCCPLRLSKNANEKKEKKGGKRATVNTELTRKGAFVVVKRGRSSLLSGGLGSGGGHLGYIETFKVFV